MKELIDLNEKKKSIIIPTPHHYYDYKSSRFLLARWDIFSEIVHDNYSILEKNASAHYNDLKPRLVKTHTGDVYLLSPYNRPIFLRREASAADGI